VRLFFSPTLEPTADVTDTLSPPAGTLSRERRSTECARVWSGPTRALTTTSAFAVATVLLCTTMLYAMLTLCRAPFHLVALAHLLRYPNPYALHVLAADVVDRHFDPSTQTLSTVRLLLKTGSLPRWAPRGLVNRSEAWIIEVSEVDLAKGVMRSRTMNLEHRGVMEVVETITVRGGRSDVEANVKSDWRGFGLLRGRIEAFGVKRFANSVERVCPRSVLSHPFL
jgi:hypothetical protein